MKELIKQHGGVIADAGGALIVIGLIAGALYGGALSYAVKYFSTWLYGGGM